MASWKFWDAECRRLTLVGGTADAPLNFAPSAAPTNGVQGDVYLDTTRNALMLHNGTSFVQNGGLGTVKTAAATLTAADHGAVCLFNSAAGDIYTLPTCAAGLRFRFVVLVTITSNNAKIVTASGSEFLLGTFHQGSDGTYVPVLRSADGTTHRSWVGNGGTTGGIKGDWVEVVGISATQWAVWGHGTATGTEATPFATS